MFCKTSWTSSERLMHVQFTSCVYWVKKRLWHRYFLVNFAKFLEAPFLQNTSGGCFWYLDVSHFFELIIWCWIIFFFFLVFIITPYKFQNCDTSLFWPLIFKITTVSVISTWLWWTLCLALTSFIVFIEFFFCFICLTRFYLLLLVCKLFLITWWKKKI